MDGGDAHFPTLIEARRVVELSQGIVCRSVIASQSLRRFRWRTRSSRGRSFVCIYRYWSSKTPDGWSSDNADILLPTYSLNPFPAKLFAGIGWWETLSCQRYLVNTPTHELRYLQEDRKEAGVAANSTQFVSQTKELFVSSGVRKANIHPTLPPDVIILTPSRRHRLSRSHLEKNTKGSWDRKF